MREAELKKEAVIRAADWVVQKVREFPDAPYAWQEWLDALDDAVSRCPGTQTHRLDEHTYWGLSHANE